CENILPDQTGLVVPGKDAHRLAQAIGELTTNRLKRTAMGTAAREFMEERSFENAFIRSWEMLEEETIAAEPFAFQKAV
ncbi:MAG: hypothetical protein ACOC3A_03800, partial [Thermodesulfobacteriota bacterium]